MNSDDVTTGVRSGMYGYGLKLIMDQLKAKKSGKAPVRTKSKANISAIKEEIKNGIREHQDSISAGQSEFEERITDSRDKKLKGLAGMVK